MLLLRFTARKINKQSGSSNRHSRRFPSLPDSFPAELSRPASTTQPRIRTTILGTLHTPREQTITTSANHRYQRCATMMKYYECVSQYAVNLILEPLTKRAQSVRIRTDTTLDQDCVLKATVQVCTACMIVSLLTTCMNFNNKCKNVKVHKV